MDNAKGLLHQLHSHNCKKRSNDSNDKADKHMNLGLKGSACIREGDRVHVMINGIILLRM